MFRRACLLQHSRAAILATDVNRTRGIHERLTNMVYSFSNNKHQTNNFKAMNTQESSYDTRVSSD
jgi:hypothetical protein